MSLQEQLEAIPKATQNQNLYENLLLFSINIKNLPNRMKSLKKFRVSLKKMRQMFFFV